MVAIDPQKTASQWHLSEDGRSRCRRFAPQLVPHEIAVFVSSKEPKARETAQIMANLLYKPWETAANLHEHDRRGVPFSDRETFETAVADLFRRPDELRFGRETAVEARDRFIQATQTVLTRHPTGNVAIVAHGTVITLFLNYYHPHIAPIPYWRSLTLPCCTLLSLPDMTLLNTINFHQPPP